MRAPDSPEAPRVAASPDVAGRLGGDTAEAMDMTVSGANKALTPPDIVMFAEDETVRAPSVASTAPKFSA